MLKNKYFYLWQLLRNERRSLDELTHIQNIKLKRLVRHAYENVPFYRQRFQQDRLHPEDIQSLEDIHKLPIIEKDDLYQLDTVNLLDKRIKAKEKLITIRTSGTSGTKLTFHIDSAYDQFRKAQFMRPYLVNGQGLRDKVAWFRSRPDTRKKLFHYFGLFPEHQFYSGESVESRIQIIQKIKPVILKGYGSELVPIASKILEKHISIPPIRMIFTDSELLVPSKRRLIEKAFQTEIIDIYGTLETENVAYECQCHEGYHIAIDCVIMEFVKDGNAVGPGEEGEVVCTVLNNFTTPFIRYNLRDLASYTDKSCSCGKAFPLMNVIAGRKPDYIKKVDGTSVSSTTILGHIWHLAANYISEFQIEQEDIDVFTVRVVPTQAFSKENEEKIREGIRRDFPRAHINIIQVAKIEREKSGKFREFKSVMSKKIKHESRKTDC